MHQDPQVIWKKIWPVLQKHYKRSKTFLEYKTPWELTVAVILSAQTTDDGVNKVTPVLFKKYPTPQKLAKANINDVAKILHSIGYYKAKATYIIKSAQILLEKFNGIVPHDQEKIQQLQGVGRKSAVAIISNAFNKNIGIPVDTHVIRFVKRFHLSNKIDPSKIERDLVRIIPKKNWKRAGYAIKEYGRKEGRARGYKPELDPVMREFLRLK